MVSDCQRSISGLNHLIPISPSLAASGNTTTKGQARRFPSGRVGVGGTEFRDDPYTVFGDLQINIPLSSVKEEREATLKRVAEAKAFEDMTELWQIGSKVNAEDALVAKDKPLINTHRYKLAKYAGDAWSTLALDLITAQGLEL